MMTPGEESDVVQIGQPTQAAAAELLRSSRSRQGLELLITDDQALGRVAALLGFEREPASADAAVA